jgi:polysaccharide export outer membrane protein
MPLNLRPLIVGYDLRTVRGSDHRKVGRLVVMLIAAVLVGRPLMAQEAGLYIAGPNDVLSINVYGQAQLSGKYMVEADGTFTFPLLGRIKAGGLTVRAIQDELRNRLVAGYLKDPQIGVSVDQYRSQQVFVMGEVRLPGRLEFTGSMTLIEALARVGSTTEHASTEALIVRPRNAGAVPVAAGLVRAATPNDSLADVGDAHVIHVDLPKLQTGTLSQNISLAAGDTVFIPKAETVFVSGQVGRPGEYVILKSMTIRQVLALAGGVTDRGSTGRIQIIRRVDGKETTVKVELHDTVRAGDTILVRERYF